MRHTQATQTTEETLSRDDALLIGICLGVCATLILVSFVLTKFISGTDVLCFGYNLTFDVPTRVYNNVCYVQNALGEYTAFEELLK